MKPIQILFMVSLLLFIAGCGTPKHISRDRVSSDQSLTSREVGLKTSKPSDGSYDGHLNLLYEKKIRGSADSPLILDKKIVAFKTTRQRFLGFDQITGEKILQVKKRRGFVFHPAISDSLLILVQRSDFGRIQVRNLFTGKVIAQKTVNEIRSGPIIVLNSLIFGAIDGLISMKLPGLEVEWRTGDREIVSIPAICDSEIIFYSVGRSIKAVGALEGDQLWATECGSAIVSELSLGNHLYAALDDGRIMAFDKDNGQIVWERMMEFPIRGGMSEVDERLYLGSTDGKVYCLSSVDGAQIWEYQTEGIVTAAPIVCGKVVLVGSHDRHFYSLDRTTGQLIDRRRLEGAVTQAAAVANDRIFVACRQNRLYCFRGY